MQLPATEEVTQTDETAEPLDTEENASETEEGDNVEVSEDNVGEAETSEEGTAGGIGRDRR